MSQRLSRLEKVGFGMGDVGVNISMMSMSLVLTYFYTDVFGIRPEHLGVLLLLVRVLDAFTDLGMGWITDRVQRPSGRYRFWLVIGAVPFGLSVYLVFANPQFSYEGKLAWAYSSYIFNSLMFTLVTIPYIALIGAITASPEQRLAANGYRFVLAKGSVLLVTSSLPFLAAQLGGGDNALGFPRAMAIMALVATLALFFCYATTRERVVIEVEKRSFLAQLGDVARNDQWRRLALSCLAMMTGFLVRGSIAFHFAIYYLGMKQESAAFSLFMAMWAVGGMLATVVSDWLTRRYCKVLVLKGSLLAAAVWGAAMFFVVPQDAVVFGIVAYLVFCLLSDINTPIFWAAIADVVEYGEKQSGQKVAGMIFGTISFFQKVGMGLAGMLVGWLLASSGYAPNAAQSDSAILAIMAMMFLIPAGFFALAALAMRGYHLGTGKPARAA
jgi:glycoside/pentoside/hexuronide:cation symporter, GPH family